ncbi:MAG: peptidoglycan bridge formation glycyltransferase FemA/FemB family protein [Treponema sp.]|jgi:lipid II:glycine glycyltransferase (peptidoglycan interpeptide bridge formation enzyme)|nr:peptidoglycan bridge formation glycyltransferase FemA/FemB family protein [Treponema sp.]
MPHNVANSKELAGVLKDLQKADLLFCDRAESFLQSGFWGGFKARFGWEALAFRAVWDNGSNRIEKPLLVLRRRLAPGIALAYVPWGPELPDSISDGIYADCFDARETALRELAPSLRKLLPRDTVFIRFDIPWYTTEGNSFSFSPPFVRSVADIQTPDTVLIDLSQSMESVMEQMKPKWRYNARYALKKGVSVRRAGVEQLDLFYALLKETARRDGIAIHGAEYYRALFASAGTGVASSGHTKIGDANFGDEYPGQKPDIRLYLAEHEGDVLAGIVTLFREHMAVYLYGASSGSKRNLMAPYALQVLAMEDAKASGCVEYDLYGIPPNSEPSHPMAGLYLFKTGFGGKIVHRPGCWDYPCYNLLYHVYFFAEKVRKGILNRRKR